MEVIQWLEEPLRHALFQRSLLALLLAGVLCGVVGSFVVVRGIAFLGDALAHAVTPGVAVAYLLNLDILIGALVAALLAVGMILWLTRDGELSEQTAIGIVLSGMMALGVALISRIATYQVDLVHLLFGSPLGISRDDLYVILALGGPVIVVILLLFKEMQVLSFDPPLAASLKLPIRALQSLLLILVAVTVVASLRTLGVGLMLAMLITPASTARLLCKRLRNMLWLAALLGMLSGFIGFYTAYYAAMPTGVGVVLTATVFFLLALVWRRLRVWRARALA